MGEHEDVAERVLAKVLGVQVARFDYNDGYSKPDLVIGDLSNPIGFCEVVADRAQRRWRSLETALEQGNKILEVDGLQYNWWVWPKVNARVKARLILELPQLLKRLDAAGVTFDHLADSTLRERIRRSSFYREIDQLGVEALVAAEPAQGAAVVRFVLPGAGGPARLDWREVLDWCAEFLSDSATADVRKKLGETRAAERHVFVTVNMSTDWPVQFALSDDCKGQLPDQPPALPTEITHLWLVRVSPPGRCIAWLPDRGGWIDYEFGPWHDALGQLAGRGSAGEVDRGAGDADGQGRETVSLV